MNKKTIKEKLEKLRKMLDKYSSLAESAMIRGDEDEWMDCYYIVGYIRGKINVYETILEEVSGNEYRKENC